MLANNITPSTIQITKKMQTHYKCARTKYEIYLEQEKKKKSKIENDNRKSIISEGINGVKTLIIEKDKTRDFLERESFLAMQDAQKKTTSVLSRKLMLYKEAEMKQTVKLKICKVHWYLLKKRDLRCKTITWMYFF